MQIEWIQIVDHRNYRTLSYSPAPHLNVLTGGNGQGKTNLLEALGLLLVGRSFRGAKPVDVVHWGAPAAIVAGSVRRGESARAIRREIRRRDDGGWAVAGEGCEWARAVPFSWPDLAILNGPPQARRGFIDGFAGKILPAHLRALARYRQILGRRGALLQSGMSAGDMADRLGPWDEQLATVGIELMSRRRAAVEALGVEFERLWSELGGGRARLEYRASLGAAPSVATVLAELERRRAEEMRRGQTLVGPHRDDLLIEIDGRDMRLYGSRGQQRLLALALRLAEVEPVTAAVGSPPVLLLDDALSELDPQAQRAVLETIDGRGQVFLSTSDTGIEARQATWWTVQAGAIEAQRTGAEVLVA